MAAEVEKESPNGTGPGPQPDEPPPRRHPSERSLVWRISQVFARIVSTVDFDLRVYGTEHVPQNGGVLLISNHQSYLDPVVLAVRLERPMCYLAKSELFETPLFGWLIRSLNAFPVRQGKGDKGAIEETIRRLKQGHLLTVFPEGSRTKDGEIAEIQRGVALVVRRAAVPIVPAVIEGSFNAWPKGHKMFRSRPIRILYGPPMEVHKMKADAIVQLLGTTLRTMHADLRARIAAEPK